MLNLNGCDQEDIKLLKNSFASIRQKGNLTIVSEETERHRLLLQILDALTIPNHSTFSFQNLLKLTVQNGQFYIAQCFVDFGYPESRRSGVSWAHKYHFQLIGIANLRVDLGRTHLRPETQVDNFVGRFFDKDIDFNNCDIFNANYYLISNKQDAVRKAFDKTFVDTIGKYSNVLVTTKNMEMYVSLILNLVRINQRLSKTYLLTANF